MHSPTDVADANQYMDLRDMSSILYEVALLFTCLIAAGWTLISPAPRLFSLWLFCSVGQNSPDPRVYFVWNILWEFLDFSLID